MGSVQTIDGAAKNNATANEEQKSKKSNNSKGSKSNSKIDTGMPIQSVQQL